MQVDPSLQVVDPSREDINAKSQYNKKALHFTQLVSLNINRVIVCTIKYVFD